MLTFLVVAPGQSPAQAWDEHLRERGDEHRPEYEQEWQRVRDAVLAVLPAAHEQVQVEGDLTSFDLTDDASHVRLVAMSGYLDLFAPVDVEPEREPTPYEAAVVRRVVEAVEAVTDRVAYDDAALGVHELSYLESTAPSAARTAARTAVPTVAPHVVVDRPLWRRLLGR